MSLKSEVATIDRRRKRLKKKDREGNFITFKNTFYYFRLLKSPFEHCARSLIPIFILLVCVVCFKIYVLI